MFAVKCQGTIAAFGAPGSAGIPSELHKTVAEVIGLFRRQNFAQLVLHLFRLLRCGDAKTVGNPDAVGIADHAAGLLIQVAQQKIGCFPAYTGNAQQGLHGVRDFAPKVGNQLLAGKDNVSCFVPVKTAGTNIVFHITNIRRSLPAYP